ncbi:MAG: DUF5916 domain-containing protein [Pyrinomonadaceae bacterium]
MKPAGNIRSIILFIFLSIVTISGQEASTKGNALAEPAKGGDTPKVNGVAVPPEKMRPMHIPKTAVPLVIDGRPDEEAWKQAAVFKDFYQTYPGNNTAPSKPTEFMMMYDEKNLYVAWKCWDDKDKIRATVAKRDSVFSEDNVRMWLDTFNDRRRAYVIGFNPLGIQADGIFTEGRGADFSVDIVMESKGIIEDWGWSVEAKIPFKSLRYKTGKGTLWGFNVARNIDRFNDEFNQWLPEDRNVSGFLTQHGKISGLDDIKYERTLEIVPSVTLSETGSRVQANEVPGGRFVNQPVKKQIGVNLKYTINPSVTLDLALNPDFAEIEADAPVVTANQRFPIFFQEKRPFFLEGADIFNSPLQVFYSRNIVDPDVALKLTGKLGKTSFGILAASDNAPGNYSENERNDPNVRPRIDEFLDKNSLFAVVRVKRDFGAENNIGFFGTYRDFPEQKNLLSGIDGRIKFTPKLVGSFQVVGTTSRRCFFDPEFEPTLNPVQAASNQAICGGGRFGGVTLLGSQYNQYKTGNGLGYYVNLDYSAETRGWFFEAGGRSKFYRADSGFTRQTNTNFLFFFNRLSTKSDSKKKIIQAQWNQMAGADYNWDGKLTSFNAETRGNLTLAKNTFINGGFGMAYQKVFEEEFGLKRSPTRPLGTFLGDPTRASWQQFVSVNLEQTPNKRISYGFFLGTIRNSLDYFFFDPATGLQDPGPGLQRDAELFVRVTPIDPFSFSVSYNKSRLVRNDNKVRSFDSDIVSVRSTYYFTRFLFTRFRLDFDGTEKNYAGQALFGWTPSPGTALYAGYNDNLNRNSFNPFSGQYEPGFTRNGRTFFIRMSYLFRKSF